MTNRRLAIVGAGGFGREVYAFLDKKKFDPVGFIDIKTPSGQLPLPVIGSEEEISELVKVHQFGACVIAIGQVDIRQKLYSQLSNSKLSFPSIVHTSCQNFSRHPEEGSIIYPNTVIMNDCRIGRFSLVNSGVTIGHDVFVGDFCNISPGVNLAGRISIGNGSSIGIGSSIKENINIGQNVIVGSGSIVVKDVPDNTIVYGVAAKVRGRK